MSAATINLDARTEALNTKLLDILAGMSCVQRMLEAENPEGNADPVRVLGALHNSLFEVMCEIDEITEQASG
jgi:hypothetical protein